MNFYEDKIEAYLTGKLNAADKLALEEGMTKDPLLKNEVDLQNDIIESLKNSRKIQLKNRLNNIDVTTTSTGVSSAVKIAASFITIGIIGAGVYYMTVVSSKDKQKENVTVVMNEDLQVPELKDENISNTPVTALEKEVVNNTANKQNQNNSVSNTTSKENKSSNNSQNVVAQANVPNGVIADTESDRINRDVTIEVPNGNIGETSVGKAENVDVNISDKNKKDFSYQYYSNKLFLYGDFNDQPYNLFEVNSSKSKQLYLYYDGKYYELKSNQNKVTRLKEVKDASVLKHLNK
jgi:hypothetical protein